MLTRVTSAVAIGILLASEGMPEELPLLTDDPTYVFEDEDTEDISLHQQFLDGRGFSVNTPVDVFMGAENPDKEKQEDVPLNTWS